MFSMKMKAGMTVGALIVFCGTPVEAGAFKTGTELLNRCKDKAGIDFCTGYVEGVTDNYMRLMKLRGASDQKSCLPDGVESREIVNATIKYLEENSSMQLYEAGDAVLMGIFSNWPACKPGAE